MWLFLQAGILYMAGVAIVLYVKPEFMFAPDGRWKEFGIGKGTDNYTTFPFWMFCLLWAFLSFAIVLFLSGSELPSLPPSLPSVPIEAEDLDISKPVELPKGYYVLNKKATKLSGVPKYVYLGAEEPV